MGITTSGYTAFRISHHRPKANIYIFTANEKLLNQLSLYWGVKAFSLKDLEEADDNVLLTEANKYLVENGYLQKGDKFINLSSFPLGNENRTNTLRLLSV